MRPISARLPSSLRWRLTAWVAAVMLLSAAVVFAVTYTSTGTELRGQIDHDLTDDTTQLSQVLRPVAGEQPERIASVADRYLRNQPYSATSALLFVLIPGASPISNHPEVFARRRPEGGETLSEQQRENASVEQLRAPRLGYTTRTVADVGHIRVLERRVDLGALQPVVGAGEPLQLVARAQNGVAKTFFLAGALILAIALFASYLAGARVTAPLRRMAAVAAQVDGGDLAPRMKTSPRQSDEVRVLAESFNHMLDRLAEAFAAQREFVADASHELRTPLTVIRGQLEVLAAQDNPSGGEVRRVERLLQAEMARLTRLVDDLLVLAQAGRTDFLRLEQIGLRQYVEDLWDGLSLTAERRFELGEVPRGTLTADPDRLAQAIRNLARNAIDHTAAMSGLVRLEVEQLAPQTIRFSVIDDGPGIPSAERELIFERFHRIDRGRSRSAGGAGLGLAIVKAIAESHGGAVRAAEPRREEGARMELLLPGFSPA